VHVFDQNAITTQHRFCFRSKRHAVPGKGARRLQFGFEQRQSLRFVPGRIIAAVNASRREQLCKRPIMEGAVLPDVKHRQVKAKGAHHPDQGAHIGSRQSNGAHSHQRFIEETQVGDQLFCTGVTTGIRRTSRFRQPCQYQIDHLPPGFIGIAFERLLPRLVK
jgi:hypothetical protein